VHTFAIESGMAGRRLDHFLTSVLPDYSRARIQEWVEEGRVLLNGKPVKASYKLRGGETVTVEPASARPLEAFPEDIPLTVLYEDDAVVAIDKPAGLVVHAGAGHGSGTLVNALLHRFGGLSGMGGPLRPGIVHRLDKGTSGVLLVAKTDQAHVALANQFALRTVEKVYWALVQGTTEGESGRMHSSIARDPARRMRMTDRLGSGREAYTRWRVMRRFARFTLLEVTIGTGRTHQIRVHLSSMGHPIAGDALYGAAKRMPGMPSLDRPWLHARQITFTTPASGERVTVESPVPTELEAWLALLA
jgi:23S rRNA pseudouridine1911/1915/1917 synthase